MERTIRRITGTSISFLVSSRTGAALLNDPHPPGRQLVDGATPLMPQHEDELCLEMGHTVLYAPDLVVPYDVSSYSNDEEIPEPLVKQQFGRNPGIAA